MSNFLRIQQANTPRSQYGHCSRSWQGFILWYSMCYPHDILPSLTECTFMLPYFIVSVGVILNFLTCISHLNLHMQACLSRNWERHAGINHCRHFHLNGSHTSPILLCFRILCLYAALAWRGFWFLFRGRKGVGDLCWAGCVTD